MSWVWKELSPALLLKFLNTFHPMTMAVVDERSQLQRKIEPMDLVSMPGREFPTHFILLPMGNRNTLGRTDLSTERIIVWTNHVNLTSGAKSETSFPGLFPSEGILKVLGTSLLGGLRMISRRTFSQVTHILRVLNKLYCAHLVLFAIGSRMKGMWLISFRKLNIGPKKDGYRLFEW